MLQYGWSDYNVGFLGAPRRQRVVGPCFAGCPPSTAGFVRVSEVAVRLSTETKHSLKTTELWAMLAIVAGILIASWLVGDNGEGRGGDRFPAVRAWSYVAIVGSAYLVSRGLAKAGSREPYWAGENDVAGRDR